MGRPTVVSVGPLASASATQISLSQKAAGARNIVLNGAAGSFSANSVCLSQTPGAAGPLTLNGALASSVPTGTAVAYLGQPQRIYITAGSDESAKTFTVVGVGFNLASGPYAITEVITGPNASVVSSTNTYQQIISITASAATTGAITVGNYGTATLDTGRRVLFTSGGNDSGITFALAGADSAGNPISETVTGANASTAVSLLDYKTITSIRSSGAVATTLTVGTNGVAASPWIRFSDSHSGSQAAVAAVVTGTVNYDVQTSMDDPDWLYSGITPASMTWLASLDAAVVGATASKSSYFAYTPLFCRVLLNSGTGTVTMTVRQQENG